MQITIDPPPDPEPDLIQPITPSSISQWPDIVLSYEGSPDFPAFESYRDELLPPREHCFGEAEIDSVNDCDRNRPVPLIP